MYVISYVWPIHSSRATRQISMPWFSLQNPGWLFVTGVCRCSHTYFIITDFVNLFNVDTTGLPHLSSGSLSGNTFKCCYTGPFPLVAVHDLGDAHWSHHCTYFILNLPGEAFHCGNLPMLPPWQASWNISFFWTLLLHIYCLLVLQTLASFLLLMYLKWDLIGIFFFSFL